MIKLIEKLFTEPMTNYPYEWAGNTKNGCITHYVKELGFILHGPRKGEHVFKTNLDDGQAFEVTYANEKTKRLRVKPTQLHIQYNEILREHRMKFPDACTDPTGAGVSLVREVLPQ